MVAKVAVSRHVEVEPWRFEELGGRKPWQDGPDRSETLDRGSDIIEQVYLGVRTFCTGASKWLPVSIDLNMQDFDDRTASDGSTRVSSTQCVLECRSYFV